jgi:hypothetical protein
MYEQSLNPDALHAEIAYRRGLLAVEMQRSLRTHRQYSRRWHWRNQPTDRSIAHS